jgi:hypothetical protein
LAKKRKQITKKKRERDTFITKKKGENEKRIKRLKKGRKGERRERERNIDGLWI